MLPSRRAVLLFGFGSSVIRATLHAVQTVRGAEGYLQAQETLALALPVGLVTMTIVYAALAALGGAISARVVRRSGPWRVCAAPARAAQAEAEADRCWT